MRFPPLLTSFQDPKTGGRDWNRWVHTKCFKHEFNPRVVDIFQEDWDNLVILDACRYDAYKECVRGRFNGKLEQRESKGGATYRFIRANFTDQVCHDVVYVSNNEWFRKLRDEINTEVHRYIGLQDGDQDVKWADDRLETVTAETVTQYAIQAADEHPKKRLIIHYLQPHHPFLGEVGQEYFDYPTNSLNEVVEKAGKDIADEFLWDAYIENLEMVLNELESLIPALTGKTVITADHGEMIRDRHEYIPIQDSGHHAYIWNDETVKIPWHVLKTDERKTITEEKPVDKMEVSEEQLNDRLRNLGYKL